MTPRVSHFESMKEMNSVSVTPHTDASVVVHRGKFRVAMGAEPKDLQYKCLRLLVGTDGLRGSRPRSLQEKRQGN